MSYAAELAGLYQESVDAMDYARMGERIDAEIAALCARVEALEAALREIGDWAPNWALGVDENVDAVRKYAIALLEQKP